MSRVKGRGQGGVGSYPVEGTGDSGQPPGMLPFRAWCSAARSSSAQLLHIECASQLAACAAGYEGAQLALGSS